MISSLVGRRIEDVEPGGFPTGVTRFDRELRRVFPDLRSITPACLPTFTPADVVICDNHLSMLVPDDVPTIVVHHGCAASHWHADETWRNANTARIVDEQRRMLCKPNRLYVAPSTWVRGEFARWYGLPADYARVIVNWVPVIAGVRRPHSTPMVVLHDARDENKGASLIRALSNRIDDCEFRQLRCTTDAERLAAYRNVDAYLCASYSEGGSYSMADAEAARLPIVTTDCGNARDFAGCYVTRGTPFAVTKRLQTVWRAGRPAPSFYETYTLDVWAGLWRQAVEDVRCGSRSALLAG